MARRLYAVGLRRATLFERVKRDDGQRPSTNAINNNAYTQELIVILSLFIIIHYTHIYSLKIWLADDL